MQHGAIELQGPIPWGSNLAFLAQAKDGDVRLTCIYKPTRGERPLWDFPPRTLAQREVAAYVASEALGWGLVPATTYRPDGPYGAGSVQLFVDAKPDVHYFNLDPAARATLQRVAVFDVLVNNADRKGGHVIQDHDGRLWLIDHGVCFHQEFKLRTVIWDFAGQSIPEHIRTGLADFGRRLQAPESDLRRSLDALLAPAEVEALCLRTQALVARPIYPDPGPERATPWPPI